MLFDCDLEKSIECSILGNKTTIAVSVAGDDAVVIDALTLILPNHAAAMNGKRGVVKGPDVNNGARVNVVLDGGQTFSVKPENCVVVR